MSRVVELFFRERNMKRKTKRIDCYKGERRGKEVRWEVPFVA